MRLPPSNSYATQRRPYTPQGNAPTRRSSFGNSSDASHNPQSMPASPSASSAAAALPGSDPSSNSPKAGGVTPKNYANGGIVRPPSPSVAHRVNGSSVSAAKRMPFGRTSPAPSPTASTSSSSGGMFPRTNPQDRNSSAASPSSSASGGGGTQFQNARSLLLKRIDRNAGPAAASSSSSAAGSTATTPTGSTSRRVGTPLSPARAPSPGTPVNATTNGLPSKLMAPRRRNNFPFGNHNQGRNANLGPTSPPPLHQQVQPPEEQGGYREGDAPAAATSQQDSNLQQKPIQTTDEEDDHGEDKEVAAATSPPSIIPTATVDRPGSAWRRNFPPSQKQTPQPPVVGPPSAERARRRPPPINTSCLSPASSVTRSSPHAFPPTTQQQQQQQQASHAHSQSHSQAQSQSQPSQTQTPLSPKLPFPSVNHGITSPPSRAPSPNRDSARAPSPGRDAASVANLRLQIDRLQADVSKKDRELMEMQRKHGEQLREHRRTMAATDGGDVSVTSDREDSLRKTVERVEKFYESLVIHGGEKGGPLFDGLVGGGEEGVGVAVTMSALLRGDEEGEGVVMMMQEDGSHSTGTGKSVATLRAGYVPVKEELLTRLQSEYVAHMKQIEDLRSQLQSEKEGKNASSLRSPRGGMNADTTQNTADADADAAMASLKKDLEEKEKRILELEHENEEQQDSHLKETNRLREELEQAAASNDVRSRAAPLEEPHSLKLERLRTTSSQQEQQIMDLTAQIQQLELDRGEQFSTTELNNEIANLEQTVADRDQRISFLTEQSERESADVVLLKSGANQLRKEIDDLERLLQERDMQLSDANMQLQEVHQRASKFEAVAEMEQQLQNEMVELKTERERVEEECERLREDKARLEEDLNNVKMSSAVERDETVAELRWQKDQSEEVLSRFKFEYEQRSEELNHLKEMMRSRELEIIAIKEDSDRTSAELEERLNVISSEREEELVQMNNLKQALSERDLLVDSMRQDMDESAKLATVVEESRVQLQQKEEMIDSLKAVVEESRVQLQQKEEMIDSLKAENLRVIQETDAKLHEQSTQHEYESEQLRSQIEQLDSKLSFLKEGKERSDREAREKLRSAVTEETEQLKEKLEELNVELSSYEEREKESRQQIEELQLAVEQREGRISELEDASEQGQQETLAAATKKFENDIAVAEKEVDDLRIKLNETEARLTEVEKNYAEKQAEVETLRTLSSEKEEELDRLRASVVEKEERIDELLQEVEEARQDAAAAETAAAAFAGDDQSYNREDLEELQEQVEEAENKLSEVEREKDEQHEKLTNIIVKLEKEKHEHEQTLASLNSDVLRLKMRVKEEAEAAGLEMVKILTEQRGHSSLNVNEMEKDFLKVYEEGQRKDEEENGSRNPVDAANAAGKEQEGMVTLDAVYVAHLKQQIMQSRMTVARMEKQIAFVKGMCHQIVESLRAELTDVEEEKLTFEKDMLNQLATLSSEQAALEEDHKKALQGKDTKIEALEKKIESMKRSGRMSPLLLGRKFKSYDSDSDLASVSSQQDGGGNSSRELPPTASPLPPSGSDRRLTEDSALADKVSALEREKEKMEKDFEEKREEYEREKENLESELLDRLKEKEDKILELYDKLEQIQIGAGEVQSRSCPGSPGSSVPSTPGRREHFDEKDVDLGHSILFQNERNAALDEERLAALDDMRDQLEESKEKVAELTKTVSDQRQVIETLKADIKIIQEKPAFSTTPQQRQQQPGVAAGDLSQEDIVSSLERVTLIHDQATASMETLQEMIRELQLRHDDAGSGRYGEQHQRNNHQSLGEREEAMLALLFKSKQVRENLRVSLQLLESKLLNRLDSLDDELGNEGSGPASSLEARDVAASIERKSIQIRDEARISLVEIEKEFLGKLSTIEHELGHQRETIVSLEGKCEEQELTLKELQETRQKRKRRGPSAATRSILEKLEEEVQCAVKAVSDKDGVIQKLDGELRSLQGRIHEAVSERVREQIQETVKAKDGEIAKLENEMKLMQNKVRMLEYDFSSDEEDKEDKSATPAKEESPKRRSSTFSKVKKYTAAVTGNDHLGYC